MNERITKSEGRNDNANGRTDIEQKKSGTAAHHFMCGYTVNIKGTNYPVIAVIPDSKTVSDNTVAEKIRKLITEVA